MAVRFCVREVIMIITKLIGGLGNQMFQYAIARRIARNRHELLKLDITSYQDYKLWNYTLNHLNIIENIATPAEIKAVKSQNHIRERFFHFDPAVLSLKPDSDIYLDGYWQSEKYFKDIVADLRREFTVKTAPAAENARLITAIKGCNSVAIHIRRGDYVSNPIIYQYHGVCPLDYYLRAMARLKAIVVNPHYFIFSDDQAWTGEYFQLEDQLTFVTVNGLDHGYEDLRLMSHCKYHIIANSSFSWWGAWLADYPEKLVYAPSKWFNQPDINTNDLLPEGFRILNV
jgi:hypothetical protein